MAWQQLGNVNLTYDWQFLAVPVLRFGLFRITQPYSDTDYVHSKIIVAQAFNNPKEFYNYRAFYPSRSQKIIKLMTPSEIIRDDSIYNRYLGFKFDSRYYRYSINRTIQIEVQNTVALSLENIQALAIENRANIALLQASVDSIEHKIDSMNV